MITSFFLGPDGRLTSALPPAEMSAALATAGGLLWVDLEQPTADETALLESVFHFHHLTIDDCLNRHIDSPKIDDYHDYLFVIAQGIDYRAGSRRLETAEIDLFLGPNYVVSYHQQPLPAVEMVRSRCEKTGPLLLERGADFLAHTILDALVDDLLPAVEAMEEALERLEVKTLRDPDRRVLEEVLLLKRNAQRLRRTIIPQRDMVNRFARGEFPSLVRQETHIYFRDIYDHVVRVEEMIESLRDLADAVLSTYLSVVSNRMNEVMKVLSIVAAIFLPLTLIAGIYGTNFENMPELGWQWGYFGMLGAMAIIAAGLIFFFWRRRWF